MRSPVQALLALFLFLASAMGSVAQADGIPQNLEESLRGHQCPLRSEEINSLADPASRIRCQTHKNQYEAQANHNPLAPLSGSTVEALVDEAVAKCNAYQSQAAKCCSGSDAQNCVRESGGDGAQSLNNYESTIAQVKAALDAANGKVTPQVKSACSKMEGANSDIEKFSSAAHGACDARRDLCMLNCGEIFKELEAKPVCAGQGCVAMVKRQLKAQGQLCDQMSPDQVQQAAKDSEKNKLASINCKTGAESDANPNDNGQGTQSVDGSSGDGSASDQQAAAQGAKDGSALGSALANPQMLSQLMGPLMGLLQKGNDQQLDQVDCSVNPNLAGCTTNNANTDDSWNKSGMGTASISGDGSSEGGGFALPDSGDALQGQGYSNATGGTAAEPAKVGSVPNGGGGVAGGGGGGAAALGGAAGSAGGGGGGYAGKTNTDILQGFSSGGGAGGGRLAALNSGMNMKGGQDGGGYTYGGANGYERPNIDLKAFLPGGSKDPTRKLAGGNAMGFQIQSRDVNIWGRISQRIRSRCTQGLLKDCIP